MEKNVAGQSWVVFAFDRTDNTPKTGLSNIVGNLRIDGASAVAIDDTNPTELEGGYYVFTLTAAETNGDNIIIAPSSVTADIQVIGCPAVVYTRPENFNALGVEADGDIEAVTLTRTATTVTGGATSTEVSAVETKVDAVKAETVLILADTTELQTDDIPGLITSLDAVVDTVKADTAAILTDTDTTIPGLISGLNDLSSAEANAACDTALADYGANTTTPPTASEVSAAVLSGVLTDLTDNDLNSGESITVLKALRGIFNRFFRAVTQTSTEQVVKNDSDVQVASMAVSDDGTTQTKGTAT